MEIESLVSVILALSLASERLVEVVKGIFPKLGEPLADVNAEARRRMILQLLAIAAGITTAVLAADTLKTVLSDDAKKLLDRNEWELLVGLGLLASGGSGLWNGVLGYVQQIKNLKKLQVKEAARLTRE